MVDAIEPIEKKKATEETTSNFDENQIHGLESSDYDIINYTLTLSTYREMFLSYPQISSNYNFINKTIKSVDYQIRSQKENKASNEVQKYVETVLDNMIIPIDVIFDNILEAMIYGYSVSELVWKVVNNNQLQLSYIKPKPREKFQFNFDKNGNIKSLTFDPQGQDEIENINPSKFLISTYKPYGKNGAYGRSILVDMYPIYMRWIANFLNLLQGMDLYALPPILNKYVVDLFSGSEFNIKESMKKVRGLRSFKCLDIPSKLSSDDNRTIIPSLDVSYLQGGSTSTNFRSFMDLIKYLDDSIDLAFGIPTGIRDNTGAGSYAKTDIQYSSIFGNVIKELHKWIASIFNTQIIPKILYFSPFSINSIIKNGIPYMDFNYGLDYNDNKANYFDKAIKNNILSMNNKEDLAYTREELGFNEIPKDMLKDMDEKEEKKVEDKEGKEDIEESNEEEEIKSENIE